MSNRKAFLGMVKVSELGLALIAKSDNGYNVIVGSTAKNPILFSDYSDHPRKLMTMTIKGKAVKSTGAGAYQVLERYFDHYKKQLRLPDFSPSSQDAIAIQLIRECKALDDIDAGRFQMALSKCRSRWASLPGAGYDQHENDATYLQSAYINAGGKLA
jgi:muramidase (phage lysozyme)